MVENKAFGIEVHRLRKDRGLSQVELSRLAGLDQSYLSRIERGDDPPPSSLKVYAIADALGADRETLLHLAGKAEGKAPDGGIDRNLQIAAAVRAVLPLDVQSVGIIVALVDFLQVMNRMVGGSHELSADQEALTRAYHQFKREAEGIDDSTRREILDRVMTLVQRRIGTGLR